jgi:opacity protein-like surface antigen
VFKISRKYKAMLLSIPFIANGYCGTNSINIGNNSNNNYISNSEKSFVKTSSEKTALRTGFSFGPHFGYQINNIFVDDADFTNATNGIKSFDFNGSPLGFHIDYNFFVNNSFFVGIGYDINHSLANKSQSIKIKIPYFNGRTGREAFYNANTNLIFKKGLSQFVTGRFGISNKSMAIDISLSVVRSSFTQGFRFIDEGLGFNENYIKTTNRIGIAPGFGITVPLNQNFSVGFKYQYEIYPKRGNSKDTADTLELIDLRSKERMTSHNMALKLSYHL